MSENEDETVPDDAEEDALVYEALKAYAKKNHIRLQ